MPDASNSGSEKTTDLKLVDESADDAGFGASPGSSAETASDSDDRSRRGVPVWLFVLLAITFVLVVLWQVQVTRELEAEVARVEDELARSTALLEAHRARLAEVRTGIHALSDQLDGLRSLADRPVAEGDASLDPFAETSETADASEASEIPGAEDSTSAADDFANDPARDAELGFESADDDGFRPFGGSSERSDRDPWRPF